MKAKVTRRSHARREAGRLVTYNEGDEIEVSERELKAFSDRLEAVPEPKAGRPKKSKPEPEVSDDGEATAE